MTPTEFRTLKSPHQLTLALQALWHDARGDWERAHVLAQEAGGADGDWVHAYLHRKEGDEGNAGYWYSRAGHSRPNSSLDAEWKDIVSELLSKRHATVGKP